MKERYRDLDIVKGIAMLTVLLNHSFILVPINIHDRPWSIYCQDINATFFVCSFFVVSGYLFNNTSNKSFSISNIWRKIKRLLIPYLSFSALNLLMKMMMPSLVNKQVNSTSDYLKNMVVGGGELWFLYVLLLIFLIWMIVLSLVPKKSIPWITIALFVFDIAIGGREASGIFMWPRVAHFSVFFLCGYMLRDANWFRRIISSKNSFVISSILFVLLCVCLIKEIQTYFWGWPLLCFIGCWFVWSLACQIGNCDRLATKLEYVGVNSLGYYWLNGYVLVIVRTFVVTILGINYGPLVVLLVFLLCAAMETLIIIIVKNIPKLGVLIGV